MKYSLAKELQMTLPICNPELEPTDFLNGTFLPRDVNNKPIGLTELIEACGQDLRKLQRVENSSDWVALTHDEKMYISDYNDEDEFTMNSVYETGKTPEEAVAKLYLQLVKASKLP